MFMYRQRIAAMNYNTEIIHMLGPLQGGDVRVQRNGSNVLKLYRA
jgi:hypothetical protein